MHSSLVISQTDPRPLYLQVKEQIQRRIALGDWSPGAEIPSIRTLAAAIQVSVITIKRAYLELEREGAIVTRQGKGSFVAERPDLSPVSRTAEVDAYLAAALRAASLLGMGVDAVGERLRALASESEREDS
ncbi:MAG: GntR family transcriptional regulator [Steroidobacteraceae bacterium]